ncbi:response regulator [Pseudoduganella lutea]|uniref:Response regulator n=2 Tax=Pseudoduganella lutea TaxID=321985 RepID=A0A4P6L7T4_9BURK|nr:response regulator [Pseudoduganella lutea]
MIEDDMPAPDAQPQAGPPPWKVLIVDDDVDVHVVTKFSLSNAHFMGRRLSFLHAYSSEEALSVLRSHGDTALVLLDVIMETADAGLKVARRIRDELRNPLVRVVLRTGQPGQALEHSIILDYDINDFWCKTDLTTRKLFTTVIASLRSYHSLHEAEQRIARAEAALRSVHEPAAAMLAALRAGQGWSGEIHLGEPAVPVRVQVAPGPATGQFTVTGRFAPDDDADGAV